MLKACAEDFLGSRSRLILRFGFEAGLRESEIVSINLGDIDMDVGCVLVRDDAVRICDSALSDYMTERAAFIGDCTNLLSSDAPLIVSASLERPTIRAIRKTMSSISKKSEVDFSFHDLRYSFIQRTIADCEPDDALAKIRVRSMTTVRKHIS